MTFFRYAVMALAVGSFAQAEDLGGLKTSVSVDTAGQFGLSRSSGATNRIDVREAELLLYAPADHVYDGQLNIAAHTENGVPQLEVHEAYLGSSKMIPRSRFRLGLFFLGIGRLNQTHRHDWPFVTAPKYHQLFFAEEGATDTGIEYTFLAPTPFFLELTAGVTNGFIFGHDHSAGRRPLFPTHYLHALTYTSMPWDGGAQIGLNYVGRKAADGVNLTLLGIDFAAKWRESQILKFLLQSEVWYRSRSGAPGEFGFYLYPQRHLAGNWYLGARLDYYTTINQLDAFGGSVPIFQWDVVPSVTYRSSEFALFRLSYDHSWRNASGITSSGDLVEMQAVFFLGAHPAHDF